MASEEASVAKIALDLHAELGPAQHNRRSTISRNERRRNEARFVFNKIISSHYRDKANDYSRVGALFITWAINDLQLHGKDSEVNQLRSIFDQELGHETDAFEIPPESPESALNLKVAQFVHRYDDKNALLVLYYAGHGFESDKSGLSIAAIDEGDGERGDPRAFFPDVMRLLHVARSDVLLIIDCCYASKAFLSERHGRRKFELLASSMSLSPSPGQPGSFTAALIKVLKALLQEPEHKQGFSTSVLYSRLFHYPTLREYTPFLFDQSQFDYGKIWLRPQRSAAKLEMLVKPFEVALDLKIHLSLTKKDPVGLAMNELAKALQYLPHVHHIDFLQLHAGDQDVAMFLKALRRASNVKKVIRILKERVKARKLRDLEAGDPHRRIPRPPSFNQYITKIPSSYTQDWSSGVAKFSNGTVIPVKSSPNNQEEGTSSPQQHLQSHRRRRAFSIPGVVYFRYMVDFTGIWYAVARLVDRLVGHGVEDGSSHLQGQADGRPAVSGNSEALSKTDVHATDSSREWKRHRRRGANQRMIERAVWVICIGVVYMWKAGKL